MATYTTTIDDTSSSRLRSVRDRYAVANATAVSAASIYPNVPAKDTATVIWTLGSEPDGTP